MRFAITVTLEPIDITALINRSLLLFHILSFERYSSQNTVHVQNLEFNFSIVLLISSVIHSSVSAALPVKQPWILKK